MKSIRIISMLLAVLVITCTLQIHGTVVVNAEGFDNLNATEKVEQKIPFADNRVLVVLTNEESLKFSKYSVSSFPELSCSKVTNLTEESDKLLKAQIYGDSVKTVSEIPQLFTVNKNTYRTILCVELNNSGYNEVAKAIKILSQHEGVQSAEPDFYLTIPDTNCSRNNPNRTPGSYPC